MGSSGNNTGPAGSRTASGLSRRRTHFKGPPPSFYRNGGWGAQYRKRQAYANNTNTASAGADTSSSSSSPRTSTTQQSPPPPPPPGFDNDPNDVPHFDRDAHFRTQEQHQQRWRNRRQQQEAQYRRMMSSFDNEHMTTSIWLNFFFVSGLLSVVVALPVVLAAVFGGEG